MGEPSDATGAEHEELITLANQIMPFGKYAGELLLDLPEPYLVWFKGEGWPRGKLGERMAAMFEVKLNGLESLLRPLVREELNEKPHETVRDKRGTP